MKKLLIFFFFIFIFKSYALSAISFQDLKGSIQFPVSSTSEEKIISKDLNISNFQISATDYIHFGIYDENFNLIDFKIVRRYVSLESPISEKIKLKDFNLNAPGLVIVYVIVQRMVNFYGQCTSILMPAKIYITNTLGSVDVYFPKHIGEKNK